MLVAVRVLWVIKGLGPGGAEHLLTETAGTIDPARAEVTCAYVLPSKDHLVEGLERAGVRTVCVGPTAQGGRDIRWPFRLARLVRSGDWDVVHMHSPLPASVARVAAWSVRGSRPQVLTTEHNAWGTFQWGTRLLNRLTIRRDRTVFAVSDEVLESIKGSTRKRAVTLRHGIDIGKAAAFARDRDEVRAELGIRPDEIVIGIVANFRPQKDYPSLVRAARLLLDSGTAARWVVVGQGPLEAEIRSLAATSGLTDAMLFTGFRPDAKRVMSGFDVFTLSSVFEGLPVALMEACALGLPVAATAVGGVAESLRDGVDALLVPPGDPAALADAWRRLVDDPVLRSQFAAAAQSKATEFDADRVTETLMVAYDAAAAAGGAAPAAAPLGDAATGRADAKAAAPSKSARTRAPALDIRPATADDREAVLALMQRTLGWDSDPRFADLFSWKHERNVFGPSPAWVAIDDGRVVAVRLFMRWEFQRNGEVLRAVRAVDTATDPDYQGRGLFTALTLRGLDELRTDGVDLVFNTPNDQSRPGYLKMGWREVGRLPAVVRPRGVASLTKIARARVPADLWSQPIDVGTPFDQWAERHRGDTMAWRRGEDATARTLTTHTDVGADGGEAFFRWRFGTDLLHYRVVEHDDGAVVVRARRRGPALELVHVASLGLDTAGADRAVARAVRAAGADHSIRLGGARLLHGQVPLPGGGPVLTWRTVTRPGMPPLANWALTMGDIELF
jgi:glycosyltransferase involved in cell wall biosynthesis/predicted N-acetyltransferase YhbS